MSEELEPEEEFLDPSAQEDCSEEGKYAKIISADNKRYKLTGMYREWFLDYASYVILERAVPHIEDGFKPVHRRIMHTMQRLDDGRFNKVANIIGSTMQFHPHGDASIGDALVQLGQKDLLVETQGNWGNILTGDGAAAPRYIEARLSKFALDVVFNPKITQWMLSYDGRNKEPVTLPVKFPLLLTQGVEGIAVGLASKILPHNFNELIDASVDHLEGKDFEIYPDFSTGGLADCSRYNDGLRGGAVKVRACIKKLDNKTLVISEIPFGRTTTSLIESILKANEKGKIKVRKVDDNTAQNVEILIYLAPDVSPDMTIDALYAFTDCEVSISPNSCVIENNIPRFVGVKEMLRISADQTKELLRKELEIRMGELDEDWHYSSLEKIFFEQKIYRELEKDTSTWDDQLAGIEKAFAPYQKSLKRDITRDDVVRLTEKPVRRISKFDIKKADEHIKNVEAEMEEVSNHLNHLTDYAINYFKQIKKKYGKGRERKTVLTSFDAIEAAQVVVANEKLYVNYKEGFAGYGLKRDEDAQFVCDCSDIDDIIVFLKNGKYIINKAAEKDFVGKDIEYINVFKRNDSRTIYNVVYRDGKNGPIMMKRFAVTGITRDKEYDVTRGNEGSQILYMSANPNGEAEVLKVYFKPRPRIKPIDDLDFSKLAIKGRAAQGNIFSRYAIHKIVLKEKGESTLGGQKIWFDDSINRLNTDEHGLYLGEFQGDDKLLAVTTQGYFHTTNFDLINRYEGKILLIQKFDPKKIFSATYFDAEQKLFYVKRFAFETSVNEEKFIDENNKSYLLEISQDEFPQLKITFGGKHAKREPELIDVDEFIGAKSYRAKGKRITTFETKLITFIEPIVKEEAVNENDNNNSPDNNNDDSGAVQMSLL